jgi:hypothetical protein
MKIRSTKLIFYFTFLFAICEAYAQVSRSYLKNYYEKTITYEWMDEQIVNSFGLKKIENKDVLRKILWPLISSDVAKEYLVDITIKFYDQYGRLPSKTEGEIIGNQVGAMMLNEGMKRIDSKILLKYLNYNKIVLEMMSDTECVRFLQRKSTDTDGNGRSIFAIAENMGDIEFSNYVEISKLAITSFINRKEKLPLPTAEKIKMINQFYVVNLYDNIKKLNAEDAFNVWAANGAKFDTDENIGCKVGKIIVLTLSNMPNNLAEDAVQLFVNDKLLN